MPRRNATTRAATLRHLRGAATVSSVGKGDVEPPLPGGKGG